MNTCGIYWFGLVTWGEARMRIGCPSYTTHYYTKNICILRIQKYGYRYIDTCNVLDLYPLWWRKLFPLRTVFKKKTVLSILLVMVPSILHNTHQSFGFSWPSGGSASSGVQDARHSFGSAIWGCLGLLGRVLRCGVAGYMQDNALYCSSGWLEKSQSSWWARSCTESHIFHRKRT